MPTPTALPYTMATAEAHVFDRVMGPEGIPGMFGDANVAAILGFFIVLWVVFGWLRSAGVLKTIGRS